MRAAINKRSQAQKTDRTKKAHEIFNDKYIALSSQITATQKKSETISFLKGSKTEIE